LNRQDVDYYIQVIHYFEQAMHSIIEHFFSELRKVLDRGITVKHVMVLKMQTESGK